MNFVHVIYGLRLSRRRSKRGNCVVDFATRGEFERRASSFPPSPTSVLNDGLGDRDPFLIRAPITLMVSDFL